MNTSVNTNNIESKNRVINYGIEIVRDFDGTYYVNARNELHEHIKGLPEYLPYKELKKAVKEALGVTLPPLKSLTFEGHGRKRYAYAYGLHGIEIHQEPLAFGLQDKVILGSFGESRPYAIGCTVTAYKWSTKIGEFMYRLQGEDGKEYWDVARNIIHDHKGGEKAEKERKAAERQAHKEAEAKAEIESAKALSLQREAEGKPIGVGELVVLKKYGGFVGFITKEHKDGRLTFQIEAKTWDETHTADMFTRIMAERPAWLQDGQHVLYNGELHVIEIADAFGDIATCETNRHCAVIRKPQDEAICDNCAYVSWEVLTPCTPDGRELLPELPAEVVIDEPDYYSEYQKLDHQEARPQEWLKNTTNEKRATYYRACVELERMAGDGLPLVIRADGADTEANPWNALEKRVKTARVFHLGDRVKMHYPYQCNEVTGVINRIRFDEGSLSLGGWCTHYDIRFDEEFQRPNNFGGKDTGVGNISPERIELIERAEFCPEPAADWLQPGEKVAHYLDYGDGTGDWLIGNVTGYELCDDGTVIVIYGEYRTPLAGMVKYQPEMDGKAA